MLLTGCTRYQKDLSYKTDDIYGTYVWNMKDEDNSYELNSTYTFNKDKTFLEKYYEVCGDKVLTDYKKSGDILNIEHIGSYVTLLILDNTIYHFGESEQKYNENVYIYKNMLGHYYETNIPKSHKFNLFIKYSTSESEGFVFDNEGYYHICSNPENCTDEKKDFVKYKKKNNIIYLENPEYGYYIMFYIVDGGMFSPQYYRQ